MPFFFSFFSIFYTNSTNSIARNNKESRLVQPSKVHQFKCPSKEGHGGPVLPGASQSSCRAEHLCVLKNNFFEGPSLLI